MSEPVVIYRHRASFGPDRYYYDTQVPNEFGWSDGVPAFRADMARELGTIPIYSHSAPNPDRYYYDRQIPNDYGWSRGEVLCYAYDTRRPGTIPIYQHGAENPGRYILDALVENNYGWSKGALLFYAYPAATTLLDELVGIIGLQGTRYRGTTYQDSRNNKFSLLDTPQLWDKGPVAPQPIPGCQDLLNQIMFTVGIARSIVDITLLWQLGTTLPLPAGGFQHALSQGLWSIADKSERPLVRILIGIPLPFGEIGKFLGPEVAMAATELWLRQTIELDNRQKLADVPYKILIKHSRTSITSFNHAKIVAGDGQRAVVGGHNLWAKDYLGASPVHDVSGLIEGPAAAAAHAFCDYFWSRELKGNAKMLIAGRFVDCDQPVARPALPPASAPGTTRMLSLGRLGSGIADEFTVTTNASVSARVAAICRAKETIRISQQSLYFSIGGFDFYTVWALIKAMQEGVKVQIVISNDSTASDGGYTGGLQTVLDAFATLFVANRLRLYQPQVDPARSDLGEWAHAALRPPHRHVPLPVGRLPSTTEYTPFLNELNGKLSLTRLYHSPDLDYWQVGMEHKVAANHAKVYIIDDTHFYVGSDNMYLSGNAEGLQEYGHLIEGQTETKEFIEKYWNKIWKNSSPHAVKAVASNVKLSVPRPPPIVAGN